jgi:drug/metabolite transporter (DMT)-like permease
MAWASLFLLPFFVRKVLRQGLRIEWMHLWAGLALALHFAFWIASLRFTSVAVSVVLVNTSPVMVAALAYFFLGERLTSRGIAGLILSLFGSGVLVFHDLAELGDWRGPVLAIAGAAALGIYLLFGRRLRQDYDLLEYVYPTYVIAALTLFPLALVSGQALSGFSAGTHLSLALLGLVPQCLGHTSYNWALRFLPATTVSTLILAEPFLATVLAWWLLHETVGWLVLFGGGLVAAGIVLVSHKGVRAQSETAW